MQSNSSSAAMSAVLNHFLIQWPLLLLIVGSMGAAIFFLGRARVPAVLVLIGLFVVLMTDLATTALSAWSMHEIATSNGADRDRWMRVMPFVYMFVSLFRTAGWAAVIAAVFVGRPPLPSRDGGGGARL